MGDPQAYFLNPLLIGHGRVSTTGLIYFSSTILLGYKVLIKYIDVTGVGLR